MYFQINGLQSIDRYIAFELPFTKVLNHSNTITSSTSTFIKINLHKSRAHIALKTGYLLASEVTAYQPHTNQPSCKQKSRPPRLICINPHQLRTITCPHLPSRTSSAAGKNNSPRITQPNLLPQSINISSSSSCRHRLLSLISRARGTPRYLAARIGRP